MHSSSLFEAPWLALASGVYLVYYLYRRRSAGTNGETEAAPANTSANSATDVKTPAPDAAKAPAPPPTAFNPAIQDTRTVSLLGGMWYLTTNPEAFIVVNIQTGQRHIMWQNGGLAADKLAKPGDVPKFDPPLELQDNGMAQVDKNWYLYVDGNIAGVIHNTTKVRHMFYPRPHQVVLPRAWKNADGYVSDRLGIPFAPSSAPRKTVTSNPGFNELQADWSIYVDGNVFAFVNKATKKRHLFWRDNNAYVVDNGA